MRQKPLLSGNVVGGRGTSTREGEGGVSASARFSFCEGLLMLSAILQTHPALLALKIRNQFLTALYTVYIVQCFLHNSPQVMHRQWTGLRSVNCHSLRVKKWVMVVKLFKRSKWVILYKNPFKWDLQVSENLKYYYYGSFGGPSDIQLLLIRENSDMQETVYHT